MASSVVYKAMMFAVLLSPEVRGHRVSSHILMMDSPTAVGHYTSMQEILTFFSLPAVVAGVGILLLILHPLYNLFLHPLCHYPGPRLYAAFHLPYALVYFRGRSSTDMHALHERYGPIIRVAPNILSYTDPSAHHDIRGHRKHGQGENHKDLEGVYFMQRHTILGMDRVGHARVRRVLAHGFSAKSMQEQEPLIKKHVDLLIQRLKEMVEDSKEKAQPAILDIVAWFNYVTFDVIGDLSFGAPFDCLETSSMHPWVKAIFDGTTMYGKRMMVQWYSPSPRVSAWIGWLAGISAPQSKQEDFAVKQVEKRLALQDARPDFLGAMERAKDEDGLKKMTRSEIVQNMRLIVLAGSETTATTLSAAAFLLATHPEVQRKLAEEVRTTFKREEEIDLFSVQKLKYMLAVLNESMRVFPPVSSSLPRKCQAGGDMICGKYVPAGTVMDTWPWAMNHSSRNWALPEVFAPERWLDDDQRDPIFTNDRQEAMQPFSTGPRNCIGKNLAYVEMRLILARVVWNFDISLEDERSKDWIKNTLGWNLWLKDAYSSPPRQGVRGGHSLLHA